MYKLEVLEELEVLEKLEKVLITFFLIKVMFVYCKL